MSENCRGGVDSHCIVLYSWFFCSSCYNVDQVRWLHWLVSM